MKCPKCGFNSFESYDVCKKCSGDLAGYKQIYSITPLVLPIEEKEKLAAELKLVEGDTEQVSNISDANSDIFSFDLPDESDSLTAQSKNDPFDFIDNISESKQSNKVNSDNDIFADLLESSPTTNESPFGETDLGVATAPVKPNQSPSGSGEFGIENFSWDDSSVTTATEDTKEAEDDFDTLFGDSNETTLK